MRARAYHNLTGWRKKPGPALIRAGKRDGRDGTNRQAPADPLAMDGLFLAACIMANQLCCLERRTARGGVILSTTRLVRMDIAEREGREGEQARVINKEEAEKRKDR